MGIGAKMTGPELDRTTEGLGLTGKPVLTLRGDAIVPLVRNWMLEEACLRGFVTEGGDPIGPNPAARGEDVYCC